MIYKLKRNIPNIITISRIVSLILGFVFFIKNKIILSLIFYMYGAVSDVLDGYFARKLSAYSKFGQYLDAISDKLYFLSLIIILLLVLYFEFQTVFAYINQLNNKSKEKIVSFKGKNVIERIKLLLEEFIYYIKKPITIK